MSDKKKGEDQEGVEAPAEEISVDITIGKFFELHASGTDKYIRAYAEESFRGIMKTKEAWITSLKLMEGEK